MKLSPKVKKHIMKEIYALGTYHPSIPLDELFSILNRYAIDAIQEDGTPWSGFLCGEQGQCNFELVYMPTHELLKHMLVLTWYKFETGRYEIVSYIS